MSIENACGIGGCLACSIDGVSISYGNKKVLKDINLMIPACTVSALVGPSGCGKSTLLSCMNRLSDLTPSCTVDGSIHWSDMPVYPHCDDSYNLRERVGHIAQRPNPFPVSIRKNFHIPLKEHGLSSVGERDDRMQACLKEVGLWDEVEDRLDRNALQLSGGQQQRLCIARALSLHPAALLMDEPTSALDPMSTARIEELISGLTGCYTIVLVTHNIAQAKRLAKHWAVFWVEDDVGICLEDGSADDVINRPKDSRTEAYLSGEQG